MNDSLDSALFIAYKKGGSDIWVGKLFNCPMFLVVVLNSCVIDGVSSNVVTLSDLKAHWVDMWEFSIGETGIDSVYQQGMSLVVGDLQQSQLWHCFMSKYWRECNCTNCIRRLILFTWHCITHKGTPTWTPKSHSFLSFNSKRVIDRESTTHICILIWDTGIPSLGGRSR